MFKNRGLRAKLYSGFGSILVLLIVVSIMAWSSITNSSEGFTEYRGMARDTNLAGRLQANMLMVRMNVKDFIITGSKKDEDDYRGFYGKMTEFMAEAQEEIQNPERSKMVDAADDATRSYGEGFEEVLRLQRKRDELVNDGLNIDGPSAEKGLTQVLQSAKGDGDMAATYTASMAMRNLLLARLYVVKFLDANDQASVDRVKAELKEFGEGLDALQQGLINPERSRKLAEIEKTMAEYASDFDGLVATIQTRNDIVQNRLDVLGPEIAKHVEDVKLSIKGEQDALGPRLQAANDRAVMVIMVLSGVAIALGIILMIFLSSSITNSITRVITGLTEAASQVTSAASQVAQSSEQMAQGASEQASSLEETSASLEEMASMTRQNAENANQANGMAKEASQACQNGRGAMERMSGAIGKIKESSDETAKIIKTIDEIAFQTNLLALNAAVEAARAGEAGKGFAVVAEEVRNLAQRSAEAAKSTSELIEGAQQNADNGVSVSTEVGEILVQIGQGVDRVTQLVEEVSAASDEQAQGIEQINTAVAQMDQVTQGNAASSEEAASASEELSAQATELDEMVKVLARIAGGSTNGSTNGKLRAAPARTQVGRAPQLSHAKAPALTSRPATRRGGNGGNAIVPKAHSESRQDAVVSPESVIPLEEEDLKDF